MVLVRFSILAVDAGGVLEDSFREAVERKMLRGDPLIIRDSLFRTCLSAGLVYCCSLFFHREQTVAQCREMVFVGAAN